MSYVIIPKTINYKDIILNRHTLSAKQYEQVEILNKNSFPLSHFLTESPSSRHAGNEVGSSNYIDESNCFFIRTKALQKFNYLLDLDDESCIPIKPQVFNDIGLKKNDVIIAKDSKIGESIILEKDYPNHMLSGGLHRLPITDKYKYYIFAFIKHPIFKQQLDIMTPKGATIRHAGTLYLDCKIPLPQKNENIIVSKIDSIVRSIIAKEELIKKLFLKTISSIDNELGELNLNNFDTILTFDELLTQNRLDTGLYTQNTKSIFNKIETYRNGFLTIEELGFELSRGQNLQVSQIGKSIYSDVNYESFYKLILPENLSIYGTVNEHSYLGNKNKLKLLKQGDIIFGAEGFNKGRSFVVVEDHENTITNIHGITITQNEHNLINGIFVKQFLDYFRYYGLIDRLGAGGNGGSFAITYWRYLKFPNFNQNLKRELSYNYFTPNQNFDSSKIFSDDFEEYDRLFNSTAGIKNLDHAIKSLKKELSNILDNIIMGKI